MPHSTGSTAGTHMAMSVTAQIRNAHRILGEENNLTATWKMEEQTKKQRGYTEDDENGSDYVRWLDLVLEVLKLWALLPKN